MPTEDWSDKRERQYQHVKASEEKRGRSTKAAKRIAAATVNKTRAEHGETKAAKPRKRDKKNSGD